MVPYPSTINVSHPTEYRTTVKDEYSCIPIIFKIEVVICCARTCCTRPVSLRLAIKLILQAKFEQFATIWGVVCSTWVSINAGTALRSMLHPMGNPLAASVRGGNLMVSRLATYKTSSSASHGLFFEKPEPWRCTLLWVLTICCGGSILIENPRTSLIFMHERFQWMLSCLEAAKVLVSLHR